jgi:hypothetical protein
MRIANNAMSNVFGETPMVQPCAGDVVSFSAGPVNDGRLPFRIVTDQDEKFACILAKFPRLRFLFTQGVPVVVNYYPAMLGKLERAINVEAYTRDINVSKGIFLALDLKVAVALFAQPLAAIHVLQTHVEHWGPLPNKLCLMLGGYPLPHSGERYLKDIVDKFGVELQVYYAYGIAELDAGILVGERAEDGFVRYRAVHGQFVPLIDGGRLVIKLCKESDAIEFDTGDFAQKADDGSMMVHPNVTRVCPGIFRDLESWDSATWRRRSGYAVITEDGIVYQLRPETLARCPNEICFFEFCRRFGGDMREKPKWGCVGATTCFLCGLDTHVRTL